MMADTPAYKNKCKQGQVGIQHSTVQNEEIVLKVSHNASVFGNDLTHEAQWQQYSMCCNLQMDQVLIALCLHYIVLYLIFKTSLKQLTLSFVTFDQLT